MVMMTQGGSRTEQRYDIVQSIEGYLEDLKTPQHAPHSVTLGNMESISDFWVWTEEAFLVSLVATDRVYIRTYNQVVRTVRPPDDA